MAKVSGALKVRLDDSTFSADEMSEMLNEIEAHLSDVKSPATAAELLGRMSIDDCRDYLNDDSRAEAMRRGFRLGACLSLFDSIFVQRAIKCANQRKSVISKQARLAKRNKQICAEYRALLETTEPHKIASKLAKDHGLSPHLIREITRPCKPT